MVFEAKSLSEIIEPAEPMWIAPLGMDTVPCSRYLLAHQWIDSNRILSAEIYAIRDTKDRYLRLYGRPNEQEVPTILVGEVTTVGDVAHREGRVIIPLHPPVELPLGEVPLTYPDELLDIPEIAEVVGSIRKPAFAQRSSTFVLTEQRPLMLDGVLAVAKIHRNLLLGADPHEYFAHILTEDEIQPLAPGIRGYVVTNSRAYAQRHKDMSFVPL